MSRPIPHTSARRQVTAIEELSCIRLCRDVEVKDEGILPSGSLGTIVSVYADGEAYCVEFEYPFHALVTLEADQVVAVPGASRADFADRLRTVLRRNG